MNTKALNELLQKIPFTALLVAYAGYLAYGYYGFRSDASSPLKAKQTQIASATEEINRLKQRVKQVQEFVKTLAIKKQELRTLATELDSTKATLTETLDVPELMNVLYTEARRTGLAVLSLRPGQSHQQDYYVEQEFEFVSKGVFFQYVAFLDRVASLQKIIRIGELKLVPISPTGAKYVELKAVMKIKAYRYAHSDADELGKKEIGSVTAGAAPAGKSDKK